MAVTTIFYIKTAIPVQQICNDFCIGIGGSIKPLVIMPLILFMVNACDFMYSYFRRACFVTVYRELTVHH
ncbi:MAG: hypothetical protein EB830_02495 [Nitrosopumilus sp. H13]|nr:MAG: hypothetical protein EB830_02495 [Nitrosopumilus sp. H13]